MFGFLNVNKPPGPTSHDIVARARRLVGRGVKVGHAGTLDPFAGGVLVLCLGPATRLADYVQAAPKRYRAQVTLGATSTTDDVEGEITAAKPCRGGQAQAAPPDKAAMCAVLEGFVGDIEQVPPAHSAVHVDGRRAYKLARKGESVTLPARTVTVHELHLTAYEYPQLEIDVLCGSGTYIRALARDIGEALGTGGYCSALTRTAVGEFRIDDAVAPDDLDPEAHLVSPVVALAHLPQVTAGEAAAEAIAKGQGVRIPDVPFNAEEVLVLSETGQLLALARPAGAGSLKPVKVFIR